MNKAFFRSLHWKLTLTYTLVTMSALLTVGLLGIVLLPAGLQPEPLLSDAITGMGNGWANTPVVQNALSQTPPDTAAAQHIFDSLPAWYRSTPLDAASLASGALTPPGGLLVVVTGRDGGIVATLPPLADASRLGQQVSWLSPAITPLVASGLAGNSTADDSQAGYVQVAEPVFDPQGQTVVGVVVVVGHLSTLTRQSLGLILAIAGGVLLMFTFAAGFVGTLFGFISTRGITRRLTRLAQASSAWRQGDFSVSVSDPSGDELGRLTGDLNYMAADLQTLFQTRQFLAALEERNRIARDLHDSIKQQAFAISAQVSAARSMISRDPASAEARLQEAEQLSNQLRQDLTALVRELYSADVIRQGLPAALRELATGWERQNNLPVQVEISTLPALSDTAALALYRVAQEALSNIARHAGTGQVKLTLAGEGDKILLQIADSGQGFDPQSVQAGIGLRSMRERMEALGGELTLTSAANQGTVVTARIPRG